MLRRDPETGRAAGLRRFVPVLAAPVLAMLVAMSMVPAGATPTALPIAPTREHLAQLYLLSLAADRCGFAITAKQANDLDAAMSAIQTKLRLDKRATDDVYSQADVAFTRYGQGACNRGGELARTFRETLRDLEGS